MKSWDKLKEFGLSDEELKDFFNAQRREKYRLNKIKYNKYDMGIREYVPTYTPKKLLTRIQATGETPKEATKSILEAQANEREDIPNEMIEIIQSACELGNIFGNYPTDEQSAKQIYLRNKDNPKLVEDLSGVIDVLMRYKPNDETEAERAQYIPIVNEALNMLNVIVFG